MANAPQEPLGGGTNDRPLDQTVAETGPGLPDEAIGPDQQTLAEQTDLAEGGQAKAMEDKLRTEARGAERPA